MIKLQPFQRVILEHCFTPDEDGVFPYREILISQTKKSGKTSIAGFVGAWFAAEVEAPNLVICAANDQEQSAGRIFAAMGPTIYNIAGKFPRDGAQPLIRLPTNGTIIKAIPNDYQGEAGANYGLTLWSELWCFTSERAQRLFDELVPVPTRKNSIRLIETYAGYEDESALLLRLFLRIFRDTDEKELQPEAEHLDLIDPKTGEQLPCYVRRDMGQLVFWDHERRMPWQQGERGRQYYAEEKRKAQGREATYIRHHENRWQRSEGGYLDPAWIKRSIRLAAALYTTPMIFAVDAAKSGDNLALVGMIPIENIDEQGKPTTIYRTGYAKIWEAIAGAKYDLDETIGKELIWLNARNLIRGPVFYDDYQLHQVMLNLSKLGIEVEEFSQQSMRLLADTFLHRCYRDDLIENYNEPLLIQNLGAAKAKEDSEGRMRIVKGTAHSAKQKATAAQLADASRYKVDGAVTQSMATYKASMVEPEPAPTQSYLGGNRSALSGYKVR